MSTRSSYVVPFGLYFFWTIASIVWTYALALVFWSSSPGTEFGRWAPAAFFWFQQIVAFSVVISFVTELIGRKLTSTQALFVMADIYFFLQISMAGVFTSGWILDGSLAKDQQIRVVTLPTNVYDAHTRILASTTFLFNSAGILEAVPWSIPMVIWAWVVGVVGRIYFAALLPAIVASVIGYFLGPLESSRPKYQPLYPKSGARYVDKNEFNKAKRNRKRNLIKRNVPGGSLLYEETSNHLWEVK